MFNEKLVFLKYSLRLRNIVTSLRQCLNFSQHVANSLSQKLDIT